jgi:hypothetical protein
MIYVASPYTHHDPLVMHQRYEQVAKFCEWQFQKGLLVFSPVLHCHNLSSLPRDVDFWWEYNRWFLVKCDKLYVLMIDGYQESKGVNKEIDLARKLMKLIYYKKVIK